MKKIKKCRTCGLDENNVHFSPSNNTKCNPCRSRVVRAKRYNITIEQLKDIESIENCEVCGTELDHHTSGSVKQANIDHCHTTGAVRGVLCSYCNTALGMAFDSTERLMLLINYLKRCQNKN